MKKLVLSILLLAMTGFTYSMAPDLRENLINTTLHKYLEAYRPRTIEQARVALHHIEHASFSSQQNINQTRPSFSWQDPLNRLTLKLYRTWAGYELYGITADPWIVSNYQRAPTQSDNLGRWYKIIAPGIEAWPSKDNNIICKIVLNDNEFHRCVQQFLPDAQTTTTKKENQKNKKDKNKNKKKKKKYEATNNSEIPLAKL